MKRPVLWLLLSCVFILAADGATERRQRLRRDGAIIESVVESSLNLAGENDPLKRAHRCTGIAQTLAEEAGRAAGKNENDRVAEFGEYLHELLEQGVAYNLISARKNSPAGNALEHKLRPVGAEATQVIERLEQQLRQKSQAEPKLQTTLEQLHAGREEVVKAIKGEG